MHDPSTVMDAHDRTQPLLHSLRCCHASQNLTGYKSLPLRSIIWTHLMDGRAWCMGD